MITSRNTLCKAERLRSRTTIENLFSSGSKSFAIFPLRLVFMPIEKEENTPASILVSVPKKKFKRAVKRNRVKRQIREAYRKNKHLLFSALEEKKYGLAVAFIYLHSELVSSAEIEEKVKNLLMRITEKLE